MKFEHEKLICECKECGTNLYKSGIVELCTGGTTTTVLKFFSGDSFTDESYCSDIQEIEYTCNKCGATLNIDFDVFLEHYKLTYREVMKS